MSIPLVNRWFCPEFCCLYLQILLSVSVSVPVSVSMPVSVPVSLVCYVWCGMADAGCQCWCLYQLDGCAILLGVSVVGVVVLAAV